MEPRCVWQEGWERKIKDIEAGVDEGFLGWTFTGDCSVSLKKLSYVEAEIVGQSLTGPSHFWYAHEDADILSSGSLDDCSFQEGLNIFCVWI